MQRNHIERAQIKRGQREDYESGVVVRASLVGDAGNRRKYRHAPGIYTK